MSTLPQTSASSPKRKQENLPEIRVKLSTRNAVQCALALIAIFVGLLCIIQLQAILIFFLLALFLSAIMEPGVMSLQRLGMPQGLAILLHYIVFFGLIGFFLVSFIPIIAEQLLQIAGLANHGYAQFLADPNQAFSLPFLPEGMNVAITNFFHTILSGASFDRLPDMLAQIGSNLSSNTGGIFYVAAHIAGSAFAFAIDTLIVLLFAFFIQTGKDRNYAWIRRFFSYRSQDYIDVKVGLIHKKLSNWIRGQMLLCLCIGGLTLIVLLILQMPYVLTLAILAGLMEAVPYVGPLLAAIPAVLIAVAHGGPGWGLIVAAAYYGIQFCENNFIVPIIMKNAVDLSAVAIMFAMLIGVSIPSVIHPVLGILLSIPITAILSIFLEDLRVSTVK